MTIKLDHRKRSVILDSLVEGTRYQLGNAENSRDAATLRIAKMIQK